MSYNDKKYIGEKIRKARVNAGMTQYELAEKIGITEKHISNIERGLNFLALNNFFKLIEILGISIEYFDVNVSHEKNSDKLALIEFIEQATDKELKAYNSIIKSFHDVVDEASKKKR